MRYTYNLQTKFIKCTAYLSQTQLPKGASTEDSVGLDFVFIAM